MIKTGCAAIKTTITSWFHALMKFNNQSIDFSNPRGWISKNLPFCAFYVNF